MAENTLITTLRSFTKHEIGQFDKFLRSPYFMEGKNIRSRVLYDYFCLLKKHYPSFSGSTFTKEFLFGYIYPKQKYNDTLMRRLDSDLGKLALKFLGQTASEEDTAQYSINLLNTLNKKKLDKLFVKNLDTSKSSIDSAMYNSRYYNNKEQIALAGNNYAYTKADMLKLYQPEAEAENFTRYVLCRALEIYRNIENDKAILKRKYAADFFENILAYLKANEVLIENDDYIAMHYYEIMLNLNRNDEYYYKLKGLKLKLAEKLSRDTLRNLYITLVNYSIRKVNMGFSQFRAERFELDKEILANGIHETGEHYDMNYFLSTVRNAVSLGGFNWSEAFIKRYRQKLDPRHSSFIINFAWGALYYGRKNYKKALEHLSTINIEYSARKQQVKNLILIIHCDNEEFENALNIIDSSLHSLKNDKQIPDERKKTFIEFLNYTKRFIKLKTNPDADSIAILKKKIDKAPYFIYKEWIISKLEQAT